MLDVKKKFILDNTYVEDSSFTFVYEYESPSKHISCKEFYKYIETQKIIKLNKPLYFYHLVNKNANMDNGLISLQYMYDNKMYDLFDKNVSKYKRRIIEHWGLDKYKSKNELTREEYLDGLNLFRGEFGSSYIYFFRFPPYKELGSRMDDILKVKDIYRININDEEVMKNIKDIFYGYDMSNSDNKLLDKDYYENVTKNEYFSKYDDSEEMNFSKLNHIGIAFFNNYCPLKYLEKV